MVYYYLDSSAIVKRYIQEEGSYYIVNLIIQAESYLSTISISKTEVISALSRRYRDKDISEEDYSSILNSVSLDFEDEYTVISTSQEIINLSIRLSQIYPLKGYDCIQLSAAISLKERFKNLNLKMVFLSSDSQLCKTATYEGFEVVNPTKIAKEDEVEIPVSHKKQIPITKPVFDYTDKEAILRPLSTNWIVQGPYVVEFENLFLKFTGAKFAKATTSCTTALHLALDALGIKADDKVIVPSFTYIASANAVEYTGAEVVFCDIDLRTFNIDVNRLEELLGKDKERKIKAIMPVHLFGLCADMLKIAELAKIYNLKVIEDSACGFDSWMVNKHSGTFGDAGCFSFHPRKSITTGEGGMIITNNEEVANNVASLRDHAASKSDLQRHKEKGGSLLPEFNIRGYNYRLTDIQGALGVCQMKKADSILNKRREIAERYKEALKDTADLLVPYVPDNYIHGYQSYVCLFTNGEDISNLSMEKIDRLNVLRNRFMERLEEKGIATRQGTHAVHTLGYYRDKYNLNDEDYINSYAADRLSITLPLYAEMTDEEFEYVIEQIKSLIRRLRR